MDFKKGKPDGLFVVSLPNYPKQNQKAHKIPTYQTIPPSKWNR